MRPRNLAPQVAAYVPPEHIDTYVPTAEPEPAPTFGPEEPTYFEQAQQAVTEGVASIGANIQEGVANVGENLQAGAGVVTDVIAQGVQDSYADFLKDHTTGKIVNVATQLGADLQAGYQSTKDYINEVMVAINQERETGSAVATRVEKFEFVQDLMGLVSGVPEHIFKSMILDNTVSVPDIVLYAKDVKMSMLKDIKPKVQFPASINRTIMQAQDLPRIDRPFTRTANNSNETALSKGNPFLQKDTADLNDLPFWEKFFAPPPPGL